MVCDWFRFCFLCILFKLRFLLLWSKKKLICPKTYVFACVIDGHELESIPIRRITKKNCYDENLNGKSKHMLTFDCVHTRLQRLMIRLCHAIVRITCQRTKCNTFYQGILCMCSGYNPMEIIKCDKQKNRF